MEPEKLNTAPISIETSPLLNEGYLRCIYVELNCEQCGCWRMCIEPGSEVACPNCASTACTQTRLAHGLTRSKLPVVEQYLAARRPSERRMNYHLGSLVPYFAEKSGRAKERRNLNP